MSEIELIKKEIDKVNNKYLENVLEIISDYKKENETKNDYKGRQLYELLQMLMIALQLNVMILM